MMEDLSRGLLALTTPLVLVDVATPRLRCLVLNMNQPMQRDRMKALSCC